MSHFVVLVVGKDIEAQLAPFQENNMGDCPKEYLEFEDKEDEMLEEYNTGTIEMIELADGSRHDKSDQQFLKPGGKPFAHEYVYPEGHKVVAVPFKEKYPTFEDYAARWCGHEERDEEMDRYGYWQNPNSKWDWFELGGRWTGFFKLKPGAIGEVGSPGIMTEGAKAGTADAARKCDIDWEAMKQEPGEKAAALFDRAAPIVAAHPKPRTWKEVCDDEAFGNDFDARRKFYHDQPAVKAFHDAQITGYHSGFEPEDFYEPRDRFIEAARKGAISTFAVLKNGEWIERGAMGWWGMVSDEKQRNEWVDQFERILLTIPDDEMLSVVDCHI
jgi:hypothetical protein